MKMNEKHLKKWETIRERGVVRFVLLRGVLAWGFPMFLVMTFVVNRTSLENVSRISYSAVIWVIGGTCFGMWMWRASEKTYQTNLSRSVSE